MRPELPGIVIILASGVTLAVVVTTYAKECTVVTNGTRDVFEHELAHCNGWMHEPFEYAEPPARYVHDFAGQLTIIQCGRQAKLNAQADAVHIKGCKSVQARCKAMWAERGEDVSAFAGTYGWKNFIGCSFDD